MGEGSFTEKLKTLQHQETIVLDGPYGTPSLNCLQYKKIILIAGGIGITPCISMLQEILESQRTDLRVHLIWITKNPK